jgi:hypothetical protein
MKAEGASTLQRVLPSPQQSLRKMLNKTGSFHSESGFRLVIRSGNLNNGDICGPSIVNGNNGVGNTWVNNGSSLFNNIKYTVVLSHGKKYYKNGVPRHRAKNKQETEC